MKELGDTGSGIFGEPLDPELFNQYKVITAKKNADGVFTIEQYFAHTIIESDVELILTYKVKIKNVYGGGTWYVRKDSYIKDKDAIYGKFNLEEEYFTKYIAYDLIKNEKVSYDFLVERNLELVLCHMVTFNNAAIGPWYVEYNKSFKDKDSVYLNEVPQEKDYSSYHLYSPQLRGLFDFSIHIQTDLTVSLCHAVEINDVKQWKWYIEHDTSFEDGKMYGEITFNPELIDGCRLYDISGKKEYFMNTAVSKDIMLVLSHILRISGIINEESYAKNGTKLSNIRSLTPYLDDTDYVIVDEADNNTAYEGNTIIMNDMNITVKKSQKIVIELDPVNESEVNQTELISIISNITGINEEDIVVKIDTNDDGKVVSIIVYVNEKVNADDVALAVDSIKTDPDKCESGILCRKKNVYVVTKERSLEASSVTSIHILSIIISIVCFLSLY